MLYQDSKEPTISVNCSTPGCTTTATFTVVNVGGGDIVGDFTVEVTMDPSQSVVVSQVVNGLAAGESKSFSLASDPGGNCYDPNCQVCFHVDSTNAVNETNESNNISCIELLG